jgi:CPA2 family monovalent cation:H+ antiporter-2
MGVADVVLPEFEASLEMTRRALLHLQIPSPEIQRHTGSLRKDLYGPLFNADDEHKMLTQLTTAEQQFDLQWVHLQKDSPLVARAIGEAEIRKISGASVVGVIRDGKLEPNPDVHFRFRPNDLIAIIGTSQARRAFHNMAVPGRDAVDPLPEERKN